MAKKAKGGGKSPGQEAFAATAVFELITDMSGDLAHALGKKGVTLGPVQDMIQFIRAHVGDDVLHGGIQLLGPVFQTGLLLYGERQGWSPLTISRLREPFDELFDALKENTARKGGALTVQEARAIRGDVYNRWAAKLEKEGSYVLAMQSLSVEDQVTFFHKKNVFCADPGRKDKFESWTPHLTNPNTLRVLLKLEIGDWEGYLLPLVGGAKAQPATGGAMKMAGGAMRAIVTFSLNVLKGDKDTLEPLQRDVERATQRMQEATRALVKHGDAAEARFHRHDKPYNPFNNRRAAWPPGLLLAAIIIVCVVKFFMDVGR